MYANRLYPFPEGSYYYFYDTETGVIAGSCDSMNVIIEKINEGHEKESIINDDLLNNKYHDIKESYQELEFYIEKYLRTSEETKEQTVRRNKKITEDQWYAGEVLKKMKLSLAFNCNMRCEYCYAEDGTYGREMLMSKETAKKCIDYFFRYVKRDAKKIEVSFFGGEPLINKEVFFYSTDYINEKARDMGLKVQYILTTNGTIFDIDILKVVVANNMDLHISLDGSKETHDTHRRLQNGKETFEIVAENVKNILKNYKKVTARVTLTKQGVPKLSSDVAFLWDLGIDSVYIEPVVTYKENIALDKNSLNILEDELSKITEMMKEKRSNNKPMKVLSNIIITGNLIANRTIQASCSYHNPFMIMFTPQGDFYKCTRVFDQEKECVGTIDEGIKWDKYSRVFTPELECTKCWARRICGGGCPLTKVNDIKCHYRKLIIKKSLEYYVDYKNNKGVLYNEK